MPAALIVQLLIAIVGQLPEIVKIIEELRQSGAQSMTPDQISRCQAASGQVQAALNAMNWSN